MKGIEYIALFFLIALSLCFFGTTYGAEPKQTQCDITHFVLRERASGAPMLETLRHVRIVAVKIYGNEANEESSMASQMTKNMVNVAYDFDQPSAKKNLNPTLAAGCDKFVDAVQNQK